MHFSTDQVAVYTRRGDSGKPIIFDMQNRLRALGYKVAVDGIFGAGTETAVKAFQKLKGIAQSGWLTDATWRALFSDTQDVPSVTGPAPSLRPAATPVATAVDEAIEEPGPIPGLSKKATLIGGGIAVAALALFMLSGD